MTHTSIFACRDARGSQWQLGPLPPAAGRLTLVGWRQTVERHDGGVPEEVARVLARALTSIARVTFPSSFVSASAASAWTPVGDDLARLLTGRGVAGRIVARLKGTPPEITLISTRRPDTAIRLFDDGAFPWWLQGQVALLSEPETAPPEIDEAALLALFEDGWAGESAKFDGLGVKGIMRPGVDGDVAGLLSFSEAFEEAALGALERETRSAGFEWAVVSESEFRP